MSGSHEYNQGHREETSSREDLKKTWRRTLEKRREKGREEMMMMNAGYVQWDVCMESIYKQKEGRTINASKNPGEM